MSEISSNESKYSIEKFYFEYTELKNENISMK